MEFQQIVQAAQFGDVDAFAELVSRYQRVSIHAAWQTVEDFHLAQEVAQDAFVLAHRHLSTLRDPMSFGPWLLTIVRREAVRAQNANQRQPQTQPSHSFAIDDIAEMNDKTPVAWQDQHAEAIEAVAQLPEHEQEVVVLHYFDQLSTPQVAESLNRPIGTVTKQLSRAIQRLRNLLSEASK